MTFHPFLFMFEAQRRASELAQDMLHSYFQYQNARASFYAQSLRIPQMVAGEFISIPDFAFPIISQVEEPVQVNAQEFDALALSVAEYEGMGTAISSLKKKARWVFKYPVAPEQDKGKPQEEKFVYTPMGGATNTPSAIKVLESYREKASVQEAKEDILKVYDGVRL